MTDSGNTVFRLTRDNEYRRAGPTDLIQLDPAPGTNPLFFHKWVLETLVWGICAHEFIHVSGPTGSAKTSLLEALHQVPANFAAICAGMGVKPLPLQLYPIELVVYETPGELWQRRALKAGSTVDEWSCLVEALRDAAAGEGLGYPLIWLREIGRVHSGSVQGGLLNLMTRGDILLPDGTSIDGRGIAWVADSNYQSDGESRHVLVEFDDALKRRFTVNLTFNWLPAEDEVCILEHIVNGGYL